MGNRETLVAALELLKILDKGFESMDDGCIARLADIAMDVSFQPGTAIIKQGQTAKTFYIIVEGTVRVVRGSATDPIEVAQLSAGSFFGEMGLLNDEPRTASVVAVDEVRCIALDKTGLLPVLEDYPKILHALGTVSVVRAGHLEDALATRR